MAEPPPKIGRLPHFLHSNKTEIILIGPDSFAAAVEPFIDPFHAYINSIFFDPCMDFDHHDTKLIQCGFRKLRNIAS